MRQCDSNHFREKVLYSVERLSSVKIQYEKTPKGYIIKGSSHLLSWTYAQSDHNYLRLGINYQVCMVLLGISKNYRILNTDVFFQLPSLPLRWIYHFMVSKVFPDQDYC